MAHLRGDQAAPRQRHPEGRHTDATPSFAYEVATYDLESAVRLARQDPDADHEVKVNEVIYTFNAPSTSTRDAELTMQIRQLVGYDSVSNPSCRTVIAGTRWSWNGH